MKKLKIYLDTSVISHLQAGDVPDRMSKTLEFWSCIEQGEYGVYISDLVVAEIEECPEPKKSFLTEKIDEAPLEVVDTFEFYMLICLACILFGTLLND